jgi:hypothetical protein
LFRIITKKKYDKFINMKFANRMAEMIEYLEENFESYDFILYKIWEGKGCLDITLKDGIGGRLTLTKVFDLADLKSRTKKFLQNE